MLHDLAPWMTLRARQEHNGKRGHVSGFDAQRSRYEVRLEDEPQVIHVRPENLTQQCSVKASPLSGSSGGTCGSSGKNTGEHPKCFKMVD